MKPSSLTSAQLLLGILAISILMVVFLPSVIPGLSRFFKRIPTFFRKRESSIPIGKVSLTDSSRLRHTHIVGATGTGKTVLIEKLLYEDLKRGYGAIIIDPKGERDFYDNVRLFCKELGRESDLYLLSATHPEESMRWNPCSLGNASELQTKFFNSAIYSEPHYAKACEFGLLQAFRRLRECDQPFSLTDLISELKSISTDDKNETLKGLFFDLNNLVFGEWEPLIDDLSPGGLDILELISRNRILFVDLPTEGKKVQSSRIGRLLTQEIILISGMRKRNPSLKGDKPFSVYIDEFDAFATESFATFLNKGRSSDFMIHLAHQTLSDLNVVSPEFSGQIMGNCNNRFIFRQDDPDDAERWARFLGTRTITKQTFKTQGGMNTGDASNRQSQEFIVSPDTIKTLPVGQCVFSSKTEGKTTTLSVPFRMRSPLQLPPPRLITPRTELERKPLRRSRPTLAAKKDLSYSTFNKGKEIVRE